MLSAVASRLGAVSLMPPVWTPVRTPVWTPVWTPVRTPVWTTVCRSASRDSKAWNKQHFGQRVPGRGPAQHHDMFDEDAIVDDVEEKLDALLCEQQRRKAAVKLSTIKRKMTDPGPPDRLLSWDAIEQIRYLRRERPEEWTVARLAEGFSVPPDDILRVLKSKFTNTGLRKVKQDAKVMARLGQQTAQVLASGAPQTKPLLPAQKTPAMLADGAPGPNTLICVANAVASTSRGGGGVGGREGGISRTQSRGAPVSLATRPNLLSLSTATQVCRSTPATSISEEDHRGAPLVESGEDDDEWDGEVLTENELEELMLTTKPTAAVQVGKDFFDPEGNFLYRV